MIQAIETRYKGYRFRSRLEARWAVFFDALRLPWEYEKEGYNLGDAGLYLPDFWMPSVAIDPPNNPKGIWIEIKGEHDLTNKVATRKSHVLASQGALVVMFYGLPEPTTAGWVCTGDSEYLAWFAAYQRSWILASNQADISNQGRKTLESAVFRARSARFEHGERP